MVWRPTVRYSEAFEQYVNEVFHATVFGFDRNMIMRAALHAAPFSAVFRGQVEKELLPGKKLPQQSWGVSEYGIITSAFWQPAERSVLVGRAGDGETRKVLDGAGVGAKTSRPFVQFRVGSVEGNR